tara:strand:+ start:4476 stop:4658 length:183 start_codon:yes stop_codon:yes gene_type:complete
MNRREAVMVSNQRSRLKGVFGQALRAGDPDWANGRNPEGDSASRAQNGLLNVLPSLCGFY